MSQPLKRSRTEFEEEIIFNNINDYGAIRKKRILNGEIYSISLGIGANIGAKIEIINPAGTVLNALEVRQDKILCGTGERLIQEDEIYYKPGQTFEQSFCIESGIITGDSKDILFTIKTPKMLNKINNIIINTLMLSIRKPTGGYVNVINTDFKSYATISKKAINYFNITLRNNNGWGITNNTPLSVATENLKVTFS